MSYNYYYEPVWADWDNSDEDENDVEDLHRERHQYKMMERISLHRWDDYDFEYRFRVSKRSFHIVLDLIESKIAHKNPRSRYIAPEVQLLVALRFYALGSMEVSNADFAGVCIASVSRILKKVSEAIAGLAPQFIKMPKTQGEMLTACKAFYAIASFPRTIGAIDCTHVKIQSPDRKNGEHFRNRKQFFSINVQTIVDANLKIWNIVSNWPGSTHDQRIFNNSRVKCQLANGEFGNYIVVGDSGYQDTMYMATPLLEPASPIECLYNESQIRTRNVVERSYGVWKRRFPVLTLGMRLKLETVQLIINSCAVLHNVCIDQRERLPPVEAEGFDDMLAATTLPPEPLQVTARSAPIGGRNGHNIRSILLAQYFTNLTNTDGGIGEA